MNYGMIAFIATALIIWAGAAMALLHYYYG